MSKTPIRCAISPATTLIPTDGIVRKTALAATQGARTDLEKARMLYDWIVANTYREPKVRGCGEGDIETMLETENLGGKCADLNALFVGLCRSVGVPARDVYGLRLVPSAFGY
ncbi:MAG: transglutaminase-like domain-containing protein, partial [Polaromonas sp.]